MDYYLIFDTEIRDITKAFEDFKNDSDYIEFRDLDDYIKDIIDDVDYTDINELIDFFEENLVLE